MIRKNIKWLLSVGANLKPETQQQLVNKFVGKDFIIYASLPITTKTIDNKKHFIIVDGFIMPLLNSGINCTQHDIFNEFINQYQLSPTQAIQKFKGNYTLIVGNDEEFSVFTDRLGIIKYFYSDTTDKKLFSNDINLIRKENNSRINPNSVALYSIFNRFPQGVTLFDDIFFSLPCSVCEYSQGIVKYRSYWDITTLFNSQKRTSSYLEYSELFKKLIKQHLEFFSPKEISFTLTGGSDSRILLGTLLSLGQKPKTFTFGNPKSGDVLVAKSLAASFGLVHNHYNEDNPSSCWFKNLSQLIKAEGSSIVNYHRAYRLDGILKEMQKNPNSQITIVGHGGGEPIRGLYYDNLIVTDFVKNWVPGKENNRELIKEHLNVRFINTESIDFEYVEGFLNNLPYLKASGKEREFLLIFQLLIGNHLYQDLSLYNTFHNRLITPFLDIDYLEFLFTTQYSMIYKNNSSKNPFKRLNIPALHCNVIREIFPPLLKYRLNNDYSPAEYLQSKYLYLIKRGIRKFKNKKSESNFYYKSWFYDYVKENWPLEINPQIASVFNVERAKEHLMASKQHGITEKYWVKYTSIIMLNEFANYY